MKFSVNQQDLQKSLAYCQGVIEKRSTLPILSNVLLEINSGNLTITATDLDLIFIHKISNVEILEEGKTTTSSSIMYDIVRKRIANLNAIFPFLESIHPNHFGQYLPKKENPNEKKP